MKKIKADILAFGAHPDDVECSAAGTVIKHVALGKIVVIADLTAGEMGSHGNAESRKKESDEASKILGIKYREQLGLPDGGIENSESARSIVIQTIRKYRPEIVLCNAVYDRHPDHANAAKLVSDACFLSGLKKKETFINGILQEAWRPKAVFHYIQDYFIEPDLVIDITKVMDKKIKSIKAYKSQFVKPKVKEANSISGLIEHIKNTNSIHGRPVNARYAEGFTTGKYICIKDFFQIL